MTPGRQILAKILYDSLFSREVKSEKKKRDESMG